MIKNSISNMFFWTPVALLLAILFTNSIIAIAFFMRVVTIITGLLAVKKLFSIILNNGFRHSLRYKKTVFKQCAYIVIAFLFFLKFQLNYSDFKGYVDKLSAEASQQCITNQKCNTPLPSWENKSKFKEDHDKTTTFQQFTYNNAFNWHMKKISQIKTFEIHTYYGPDGPHYGTCGGLNLKSKIFKSSGEYFNKCKPLL